ncbi:MAG: hypothetical protein JKX70_11745 [Phycisphaerales bacterium]|nr:hypothetical protein [Phycisphaerales bacterium]
MLSALEASALLNAIHQQTGSDSIKPVQSSGIERKEFTRIDTVGADQLGLATPISLNDAIT